MRSPSSSPAGALSQDLAETPGRPLFIGACPRSGTTLLRSLLDNHPDIAVPAETDFVIPVWLRRRDYGDLRVPANRRKLAEWILTTPGRGGQRIRAGTPLEQAIGRVAAAPPSLGSVFASCFQLYADAKGKPRWGDKRPAYANHVQMLFRLFPDAQFINVVRDPRAVVASLIQIGFFPGDDALEAGTAMWESSIRNVDRFAKRLGRDQLLEVRYEDLVRAPAETLETVCDFAGLRRADAIEQMIAGERSGRFREGWHENLGTPISTVHIDKWREQLAAREIALIEYVLRPQFARFDYEPIADGTARPEPSQLRELARQRRRRTLRWRRYALGEFKRTLSYRRPVAADNWARKRSASA